MSDTDFYGELLAAIDKDDEEAIRRFIASGVDLNRPDDEWGCTPVFYAVIGGVVSIVELLLDAGADPNAIAPEPGCTILAETPLVLARQCSFLMDEAKYDPIVKLLLAHGAR